MPGRYRLVILSILLPALGASAGPPPSALAAADMVRRDAYFRESLAAIRDWETLLAAWENATPPDRRTPVLAVPVDGKAVDWPHPIPERFLPYADLRSPVRLHLAGGKITVTRPDPAGRDTQQAVPPGQPVVGCEHPGGGGKDRWYHRYHRRFGQLLTFRPVGAPLAVKAARPRVFGRGRNHLRVELRNATGQSLPVSVSAVLRTPGRARPCGKGRHDLALAPGAEARLDIPVELEQPGGGLLIVTVQAGGQTFWMPVFTHVEDVAAILAGIEGILTDAPDAGSGAQLADLRRRAERWRPDPSGQAGAAWRALFEQAGRLRDRLLLARADFPAMLFVQRMPFDSEQPFMDAHHLINRPGGGIFRLAPPGPGGAVAPVVTSLGQGVYRDVCLHWQADRILFSFGNGSDKWDGRQSYHIYEQRLDPAGLPIGRPRQLTHGPRNDCEPFYLPGGQIGFTSDRSDHFVMCGGDRHAPTLFVMNADGSGIRRLSFNMFNDYNPTVLPDGRILYCRWEYNERSVTSLHTPFTMNPDGTMVETYYGNASIRPNVVMFPRPVPRSTKIMALLTAHHGQTHGAIGLIDTHHGLDGAGPLTVLTPGVPVTGEKAEDSRRGWYSDPVPLDERTYLCAFTPTVVPWRERTWALYVGDRHGNLALIHRDDAISLAEPVPLVARPAPAARPAAPADTADESAQATLLALDVHVGLPGVRPGTARFLRVLEDVPRKGVRQGGVILTAGVPIFTVKRILGTVPVEPDGSTHFRVPANRNVYFQLLDADGLEIQRMRSVVCLKPREARTCVGCHESRNSAPPNRRRPLAARRPARAPQPPPWGTEIISFLRDVQPVLNDRCVPCHTHDREGNRVILTDDLTDQFCVGYEELLPFLKVARSNIWDTPPDVYAQPPYTYGSKVSPLTKLLDGGHHDVKLTPDERLRLLNWIDANAVYYDRYEAVHPKRHLFPGPTVKALSAIHARRCARCHGKSDGKRDTWWLSLNRRDVALSRALAAPLAGADGGWGRCGQGEGVFANKADPDYRAILAALTALRDQLAQRPRADLLSLRGTVAEGQAVAAVPPPKQRPPVGKTALAGWVHLSDLKWRSGQAGWTKNGDKVPRLDRDAQDDPLRLGSQRYRRGLGTHAPSEIVYDLAGGFRRFHAVVGAGEAGGTVVFQVFADDKKLFDSGVMAGLKGTKTVDVSVAGAKTLRLVVTDAGDNYYSDMATWADARIEQAKSK